MVKKSSKLPLITDILEPYRKTQEGLTLWKPKGLFLNFDNVLDSVFLLSNFIAQYFSIRHSNLVAQNISKLQKEKYLPERLLNFKQPFVSGNNNKKFHIIYALTRH